MQQKSKLGIVVIGRNEGERLGGCFESLIDTNASCIYVDSGSTDDSIKIARAYAIRVVSLDTGSPLSAARARNEGFEKLLELQPDIEFVQFLDGDCTLADGWLDAAESALEGNPRLAVVVGYLQEINEDLTAYNRLCALEWKSPPGDFKDFGSLGGISVIRANVFREMAGFNPDVIAGEDSELGVRIGLSGYQITKIDHLMAFHDANITKFSQWWKRSIRAGHAIGQRAHLNGKSELKDCVRARKSTWLWGIVIPTLILVTAVPSDGWSLLLLGSYVVLGFRIFKHRLSIGDCFSDAFLYTRFLLLAKFANTYGLLKFYLNRMFRHYEIIEYK